MICFLNIFILGTLFGYSASSSCENGDTFPFIESCQQYYKCDQTGNLELQLCPLDQYYNCFKKECAYSIWPPCCREDPDAQNITTDFSCDKNGQIVKDPESCNTYYVCENAYVREKICKDGYAFDNKTNSCVEDKGCPAVQTRDLIYKTQDVYYEKKGTIAEKLKKIIQFMIETYTRIFGNIQTETKNMVVTVVNYVISFYSMVLIPYIPPVVVTFINSIIEFLKYIGFPINDGSSTTEASTTTVSAYVSYSSQTEPASTSFSSDVTQDDSSTSDTEITDLTTGDSSDYVDTNTTDTNDSSPTTEGDDSSNSTSSGTTSGTASGAGSTENGGIYKPKMSCYYNGQRYSNIYDCKSYFECQYGSLVYKKCFLGTTFDCFKKRCALIKNNECCGYPTGIVSGHCLVNDEKFANPYNDRQYYHCMDHKIVARSCNVDERYHPALYICVKRNS